MNMDKKKKIINNYQLQIIIGGMLLIDVCLLIHWQILDPLRRTVEEFRLEADPGGEDISVFLEHCESTNMIIWLSLSYGYKGLLMLLGCFLALRSKHAHSHLHNDDSRYTRLSVYNLTVTSVIGSSGCFLTQHNPNIQICFMTLVVIWGCTSTLCLVFVPKLIKIRDNPNEVDPSMWFQCGDKKEDSDTSASSDSLDQSIGSLESLSIENQRLRRRIAEICDELENVALQVLEEELSLSGHEVTLAAQVSCLEASTINKLLLEDINSLEQVQRRLSMQLPILHHAYIPAVGGMTVSYSNLLSSPATPCAQQSQMSPSYQVVFTGL